MPNAVQSNPLAVDVVQGDALSLDKLIGVYATDPAGNANTITGMTTASPTVITTTTAHGFITGKHGWRRVAPLTGALFAGALVGAFEPYGWVVGGTLGGLLCGELRRAPGHVLVIRIVQHGLADE